MKKVLFVATIKNPEKKNPSRSALVLWLAETRVEEYRPETRRERKVKNYCCSIFV
jgi:hypothetical protein